MDMDMVNDRVGYTVRGLPVGTALRPLCRRTGRELGTKAAASEANDSAATAIDTIRKLIFMVAGDAEEVLV
jgi:hypothetical protein